MEKRTVTKTSFWIAIGIPMAILIVLALICFLVFSFVLYPKKYAYTPEITGTVYDSHTKKPIPNVDIVMYWEGGFMRTSPIITIEQENVEYQYFGQFYRTDENGSFKIPRQKKQLRYREFMSLEYKGQLTLVFASPIYINQFYGVNTELAGFYPSQFLNISTNQGLVAGEGQDKELNLSVIMKPLTNADSFIINLLEVRDRFHQYRNSDPNKGSVYKRIFSEHYKEFLKALPGSDMSPSLKSSVSKDRDLAYDIYSLCFGIVRTAPESNEGITAKKWMQELRQLYPEFR